MGKDGEDIYRGTDSQATWAGHGHLEAHLPPHFHFQILGMSSFPSWRRKLNCFYNSFFSGFHTFFITLFQVPQLLPDTPLLPVHPASCSFYLEQKQKEDVTESISCWSVALGMRPALVHDWYPWCQSIEKNWLSLSQQLVSVSRFFVRDVTLCLLSICAAILSGLSWYWPCTCCYCPHEFHGACTFVLLCLEIML